MNHRSFLHMTIRFSVVACVVLCLAVGSVLASGKKKPAPVVSPLKGKKVLNLLPLTGVEIEMPNDERRNLGVDFEALLRERLTSPNGNFVRYEAPVMGSSQIVGMSSALMAAAPTQEPDITWNPSAVPAAIVEMEILAFSFVTGERGSRMFYGFDEQFRTPFNDGSSRRPNEFPLKKVELEPNWFDRTFDAKGMVPFDSLAGLDLADGFSVDVVIANIGVRKARYRSHLRVRVKYSSPAIDHVVVTDVSVNGKGFFFDVVGGYLGFSGGVRVARNTAMRQAIDEALKGTVGSIEKELAHFPLTARLDGVMDDTVNGVPVKKYLLGTGMLSKIQPGVRYKWLGSEAPVVLEVVQSVDSGAVAVCAVVDCSPISKGAILVELEGSDVPFHAGQASVLASAPQAAHRGIASSASALMGGGGESALNSSSTAALETQTVELPAKDFEKPVFAEGDVPDEGWLTSLWNSIRGVLVMPYRIFRYYQYDRTYKKEADDYDAEGSDDELIASNLPRWRQKLTGEAWAKSILLSNSVNQGAPAHHGPLVAIVDTGVDYNHPFLHGNLAIFPESGATGMGDRYGYDFSSGDTRPYDDGEHGTAIAGAVLAVEPMSRILPVKVFNPWGVTSSAQLYAGIEYAVKAGAKIIVIAWATRKNSEALREAAALVEANGALLVTAAGDRGDDLAKVPSYPASLSRENDAVLTVAATDSAGNLSVKRGSYTNYGDTVVSIAAPGEQIKMPAPRARMRTWDSSGIAAGLVAGALSRISARDEAAIGQDLKARLLNSATSRTELLKGVEKGRFLQIQ